MTEGAAGPRATPPLPRSIWVVAWASVAGQVVQLVDQGFRSQNEVSLVVSVVLGALVVGYVSAGVVRARTVRVVLAWVVLTLSAIAELLRLVTADHLGDAFLVLLSVVSTFVALGGLLLFRRTAWYAWQRTRPPAGVGAPIGSLVAIGVLVGVLGGIVAPVDGGFEAEVRVSGNGTNAVP
ncbi:hypothetical protein [Nocardioides caldifontis]|uniref:hypothetical protein n=1 Tax=Nocardioides caldifontis TaxID=2588938 RepID=UPI0011DEFFAB|nr:hypothetical protein [Nocardioides caldifontis]